MKRDGKTIGWLDRERHAYTIRRNYPHDVARRYQAYGIDAETVNQFQPWGVHTVIIHEQRGQSVREITTQAESWTQAPVDALGETGKPHAFLALHKLPLGRVIRQEPCHRLCPTCQKRCPQPLRHYNQAHECPHCGTRNP